MEKENQKAVTETSTNNLALQTVSRIEFLKAFAKDIVQSEISNVKSEADAFNILAFADEAKIPLTQALAEIYPLKFGERTTMCVGVHVLEGIISRSPIQFKVIEDYEPVVHYRSTGQMIVSLTAKELQEGLLSGKYQMLTIKEENGKKSIAEEIDKTKIQLLPYNGDYPYNLLNNGSDRRTSIRFIRKDKEIDEVVVYYLHEAYQAGYFGGENKKPKNTWIENTRAMMYARCFTRGAKRYGSDYIKGLNEISEIKDSINSVEDVDYVEVS